MARGAILRADHVAICGGALTFDVLADESLSAVDLRCTVKRRSTDSDAAALGVATSDPGDGIVLDDDPARALVTFGASVTETWPAGAQLHIDVQAVDADGGVHSLMRGQVRTRARVTRTRIEIATPDQIFGDDLAFWFRAEDFVPAAGATLATWPSAVGSVVLATHTPGPPNPPSVGADNSPSAALGINGLPTVLSDGVDDGMAGALVAPFPAGSRPYIAILVQAASLAIHPSTTIASIFTAFQTGDAGEPISLELNNGAPLTVPTFTARFWIQLAFPGAIFYTLRGPPGDLEPHVFELALPNDTTGHFRVDGVDYTVALGSQSASSSALLFPLGAISIMKKPDAQVDVARPFHGHYRDIVMVRRIPTDAERTRLRAYLEHRKTAP